MFILLAQDLWSYSITHYGLYNLSKKNGITHRYCCQRHQHQGRSYFWPHWGMCALLSGKWRPPVLPLTPATLISLSSSWGWAHVLTRFKNGQGGGGYQTNKFGRICHILAVLPLKSDDSLSNTKRHFCFASCSYSLKWKQFVMTLTCVFFLFVHIWLE